MADPKSLDIAGLNEFGLPRHGEGVGPTLRPDIIAERHQHDWDRPAAEPLAYAADPQTVPASLCAQAMADDRLRRVRDMGLAPRDSDILETGTHETPIGDNELQCARRAHAEAQAGGDAR